MKWIEWIICKNVLRFFRWKECNIHKFCLQFPHQLMLLVAFAESFRRHGRFCRDWLRESRKGSRAGATHSALVLGSLGPVRRQPLPLFLYSLVWLFQVLSSYFGSTFTSSVICVNREPNRQALSASASFGGAHNMALKLLSQLLSRTTLSRASKAKWAGNHKKNNCSIRSLLNWCLKAWAL